MPDTQPKSNSLELTATLQSQVEAPTADKSVTIYLKVRNKSTVAVESGTWAVTDKESGETAYAYFGSIAPGNEDTRTAFLPSGFESGIYNFIAKGGGNWAAAHGGNNTTEANLNLS